MKTDVSQNKHPRKQYHPLSCAKRTTFMLVLLFVSILSWGQTLNVKGTVTDISNMPVIGAAVQVEGSTNGVITDLDGNYMLDDVPANATIVFSYVGMTTKKIPVNGKSVINVTLEEDNVMLEETVVIGYGTIKKSDLTGAVSVVKTEDFANRAVRSMGDALQGSAPGVTVHGSGSIDGLPSIQIRGTGNLTNVDPLYVIDGVPTNNDVSFNPSDIETIQVLKDASAAAIYGSRAANGVIIITTKKGKEGKTHVEFSTQLAAQTLKQLDFIDGDEWRSVMTQVYQNGIDRGSYTGSIPEFWQNNTDWQDEFMKTGFMQDYNFAVSGGGKDSNFRVSFGYLDNSGYEISEDMNRLTTSLRGEFRTGIFSFGESVQFGRTHIHSNENCTLASVVGMVPIIAVHDDVYGKNGWGYGNQNYAYTNAYNVVATADDSNGYVDEQNTYLRGSAWAEAKITSWLTYKLNLGMTLTDTQYSNWGTGYQYAYGFTDTASFANTSSTRQFVYLLENTLSFDKTFGQHKLSAVLGQSYQDTQYRYEWAGTQDLVSTAGGTYLTNVSGGTTLASAAGTTSQSRLLSYFGRINYDYGGRYLLQATVRRDGSSRLSEENRWGTFPSVSAGWRISREAFYNIPWMNDLKLRASYGLLGSRNIGDYDYMSAINSYLAYQFNSDGLQSGQGITTIANNDLKWERKESINFGLDMAFLNNRLQTSFEYYILNSKDVLYTQQILHTVGSTGTPVTNSASIKNTGVELSINWQDKINDDWSYSIGINLSHNRNKLTGLGYGVESVDQTTTLSKIGESIGLFYLIKTDGLYQTDEEAAADGLIENAKAGDVKYVDYNNDGSITQEDRQLLTDQSPWPKLEANLNINVNYKNWSLQLAGFGQFFKWVYNGTRATTDALSGQHQITRDYYENMWSETNKHNNVKYPRTAWNYTYNDISYSDRWLERGDYFKFSTIALGYTYHARGFFKKFMESAKFTLTAQNLLCLTGFDGYDPDFINTNLFTPGVASTINSNPRSLILGINLNF